MGLDDAPKFGDEFTGLGKPRKLAEEIATPDLNEDGRLSGRERAAARQAARDAARAQRKLDARKSEEDRRAEKAAENDKFFKEARERDGRATVEDPQPNDEALEALENAQPGHDANPNEEPGPGAKIDTQDPGYARPDVSFKTTGKTPQRHHTLPGYVIVNARNEDNDKATFHLLGFQKQLLSSQSSESQEPSDSPLPSPSNSKYAIVKFIHPETGKEHWIGWVCAEEPEARFFDTYRVDLKWGRGEVTLPEQFVQSVEQETIRVISVVSPYVPATSSGSFDPSTGKVQVKSVSGLFRRNPSFVYVRVEGRRKGSPPRFQEFTEKQATHNNAFWSSALKGFDGYDGT
jgi:hypothetical protein